jgi:glycosyltransferase involved in cell wall biosynthesis
MKASVVSAFPRPANIPRWVDWVYRPRQTSLRRCYNGMRVFLCSSSSEGFGLPNLEAMACGATLVATDLPAFREYGRHGENGLFSPPGEPAALAESLLQVLTDDELCDQLARDGLVTASRFRWDDSVDVLESLILERVSRLRSLSP